MALWLSGRERLSGANQTLSGANQTLPAHPPTPLPAQPRTGQSAALGADTITGRLLVRPTGRYTPELLAAAAGAG